MARLRRSAKNKVAAAELPLAPPPPPPAGGSMSSDDGGGESDDDDDAVAAAAARWVAAGLTFIHGNTNPEVDNGGDTLDCRVTGTLKYKGTTFPTNEADAVKKLVSGKGSRWTEEKGDLSISAVSWCVVCYCFVVLLCNSCFDTNS
jgi:hypothetical protein